MIVNVRGALSDENPLDISRGQAPVMGHSTLALNNSEVRRLPPSTASSALLTIERGSVRVRIDGGDPNANSGILLEPGDTFVLESPEQLEAFAVRRIGNKRVLIQITYFGQGQVIDPGDIVDPDAKIAVWDVDSWDDGTVWGDGLPGEPEPGNGEPPVILLRPVFVGATGDANGSSALPTVTTPSGAVVGDLLLVAWTIQSTTAFVEAPSGWTEVGLWRNGSSTAQIFKRFVANPAATYLFTLNGSTTTRSHICACYRNVATDTPVAQLSRNASLVLPSIDVIASDSRLVGFYSHTGTGSASSIDAPSSLTQRFQRFAGISGAQTLADTAVDAGASGEHTAITSAGSSVRNAVALILAPAQA